MSGRRWSIHETISSLLSVQRLRFQRFNDTILRWFWMVLAPRYMRAATDFEIIIGAPAVGIEPISERFGIWLNATARCSAMRVRDRRRDGLLRMNGRRLPMDSPISGPSALRHAYSFPSTGDMPLPCVALNTLTV